MTPEEAIQLLDNAVSQLELKRELHVKLQQAVETIKASFKEKK